MSLPFRRRMFLALVGIGTLPVATALIVLAVQLRSAGSPAGPRAALDEIATSGGALMAALDTTALDSAARSALGRHAETITRRTRLAHRAETLTRTAAGVLALVTLGVAALVVMASLVLARRWAHYVSAPIEELVDWVGRVERRTPLPPPRAGGATEFAALRGAIAQLAHALERVRRQELEQERLAAFRETARRVAHEMRGPLTAARLALRQLPADGTGAQVLADETSRLERMAREFAEFGRLPDGRRRRWTWASCSPRSSPTRSQPIPAPWSETSNPVSSFGDTTSRCAARSRTSCGTPCRSRRRQASRSPRSVFPGRYG